MRRECSRFQQFIRCIERLPIDQHLTKQQLLVRQFLLYKQNKIEIYYAPFDYVNRRARIAIIGITPGWTQMEISYRTARRDLDKGLCPREICKRANREASFAGLMRKNLISMLDGLNIPKVLGISSTGSLFGEHKGLVHTSSAIRYPVFVEKQNYTGHNPNLFKIPILKHYVDTILLDELRQTANALIIPLGTSVSRVVEHFIDQRQLDANRCLLYFPHPSGANVGRIKQYLDKRIAFRRQAANWLQSTMH